MCILRRFKVRTLFPTYIPSSSWLVKPDCFCNKIGFGVLCKTSKMATNSCSHNYIQYWVFPKQMDSCTYESL